MRIKKCHEGAPPGIATKPVVLIGGRFDGASCVVAALPPIMWVMACTACSGIHAYEVMGPTAEAVMGRRGGVAYHRDRYDEQRQATIYVIDPDVIDRRAVRVDKREPVAA
ncbi:hypothetical protein [Mycobacterium sp.]|uniref:hypothetical protein n=1 Tax=Mycobacterium sp. TaxID=1785 RepID=UPI00263939D1|nr:hypothetical protein [Mycobacterium sp.]